MYWGDVRELAFYLRGKKLPAIEPLDLQDWISALMSSGGRQLQRKTLNRKISAIRSYFSWLEASDAITDNPADAVINGRVQSPLPDYLYESEVQTLYQAASHDSRTYLIVLLLLETGMKSHELHALTQAHVDISDIYKPELWIKHTGKATKKDRKVALPADFSRVYLDYIGAYDIHGVLFPFSPRFAQLIFAHLKRKTGIQKALTPKTLRHTNVVRAYRRGEDPETIFDRIGLAPDSRPEADQMYTRLAARGI
jgi:site-specific recombinase XerD